MKRRTAVKYFEYLEKNKDFKYFRGADFFINKLPIFVYLWEIRRRKNV